MCPGQFISCQVVVKIDFVKTHHVKFSAVVITVTRGAIFSPHLRRVVETSPFVKQAFDFFVAVEAFAVGHFLSEFMALGAVGDAFEVCVRLGQVSGGELSGCICNEKQASSGYF